jgi:hypothetical protein
VRLVAEREVEVFRKPVGLKEAFLETGSSFEEPAVGDLLVSIDAGSIQPRT